MNKLFLLLVVAAASLLPVHTVSAQAQLSGTPDELRGYLYPRLRTVDIGGEAELTAYQDIARVSLLVTTEARRLNAAMADNQSLRDRLINEFLGAGIDADAISNSNFSSTPDYGWFGGESYEVVTRLKIEVTSESHLQVLAQAADDNDEVKLEFIEFDHSERDAFELQVQELAIQKVMERKALYERNLGLELRAVDFHYGGVHYMERAMPMAAVADIASLDAMSAMDEADVFTATATAAIVPGFDEVEYVTFVTVVFEIVRPNQD